MKGSPPSVPARDACGEDLARALALPQQRVRDFLSTQREKLGRIEGALAEELGREREELQRQYEDLRARQGRVEAAEDALHHDQRALELARHEHQAEQEHIAAQRQRLVERGAELDAREQQLAARAAETESQRRRVAQQLRRQRAAQLQDLQERQDDLARRPPPQSAVAASPTESEQELQSRLQAALESEREAKARNADLEKRLARLAAIPPGGAAAAAGGLTWEAEKLRILAALEDQSNTEEDQDQAASRLKIEDVIRTTDRLLAEKDHEIDQLRRVLEEQSSNLNGMAVGAAALGAVLDQDALIREERANLQQLQRHWEEMLRKSEIEISLERAKLARQRSDIEEKLRAYQEQIARDPGNTSVPAKPARGRWLARLGIKEGDA